MSADAVPALRAAESVDTVELAGLGFARLTRHGLVDRIEEGLAAGRGGWVITANVDYLQRFATDPSIPPLFEQADLAVADGIPLLWAARLRGTPLPDRVAGSDLVWLVAERAARRGWSLYLLGGAPGVAERAREHLCERFPALRVVGTSSPWIFDPPTPEEVAKARADLAATSPDLVYVALGSPKQDRLIAQLRLALPRVWWIGVGISLSFIVGHMRRAPRWMQQLGIEWVHRLAQEPRRLWRRYLVVDLPFAVRLLLSSWRARDRSTKA